MKQYQYVPEDAPPRVRALLAEMLEDYLASQPVLYAWDFLPYRIRIVGSRGNWETQLSYNEGPWFVGDPQTPMRMLNQIIHLAQKG